MLRYNWLYSLCVHLFDLCYKSMYFNLTDLTHQLPPLAAANFFSDESVLLFICFIFEYTHISEIIQYLPFAIWLISLRINPIGTYKLTQMTRFHSSYWLSDTPLYIYVCVCVCVCVCTYICICIHLISCLSVHLLVDP